MELSRLDLSAYVVGQLGSLFRDNHVVLPADLHPHLDEAVQRTEFCFSQICGKYFNDGKDVLFNHRNADHYAMFLYLLSNTLFRNGADPRLCEKIFLLNRCLHGVDAYFEVMLPDIFLFVHPIGSVLGRARYSNYFVVYQRCTIGSNHGVYPVLEQHVCLHPGASILGKCCVGRNCRISAGSILLDADLEPNSIYYGNPMNFTIRQSNTESGFWRDLADEPKQPGDRDRKGSPPGERK